MIDTQLHRQCLEVLHARTVKDFVRITGQMAQSMGFHSMGALIVIDHTATFSEFRSVTDAPTEYLPIFEDTQSAKLDPVTQHCKHFSSPIVWDQQTYVAAGRADFWEHQAEFGYRSGLGVALHLPRARHFMFGFDSDKRSCVSAKAKLGLTLDFHTFTSYAQAAAFDLCLPYPRSPSSGAPARGELDALQRSMDGLSDWEVGDAMGISETEVLLRLRRAMFKLGCATRYEAALRALKLGLVTCG
jgi:DNA-binding CsgD family transcriptional regulator